MLRAYARYLKEQHLRELALEIIRQFRELGVPLLKMVEHLPEDQLVEGTIANTGKFLDDLAAGRALEAARENLKAWEEDRLPGVSKEMIQPSDLVLVYAAQKHAILKFLDAYTSDVTVAKEVVLGLERHFQEVQDGAIQFYARMRQEAADKVERLQREQIEQMREVDQMKDQFLSILSHELRTPVNAVMGFGSILDDEVAGPMTAEQHRYVRLMLSGAETLLALINDLLDMSRIQAGRFTLNPEVTDFSAIAERTVGNLAALAEGKHLAVTVQLAPDLPAVYGDPQRIAQVLNNLVGNAIKFTPDGGAIAVRGVVDGGYLRCEVQDTGIGIAEGDLPKLFQRFSQLETGNIRHVSGTGLGLSIAKALTEAHGGQIGVLSAKGQGSTFWFTLPLSGRRVLNPC